MSKNKSIPEVDAYVKLVRTAEALHAEVSRGLASEKLTASQFSALKALRYQGPMHQRGIAAFMLKTAGNVTLVLDNLEKQGLITRIRQKSDRRVILVSLTDLGTETFDRLYPDHIGRITRVMGGLSKAKLGSMIALLQELHTTVNEPKCQPEVAEDRGESELIG